MIRGNPSTLPAVQLGSQIRAAASWRGWTRLAWLLAGDQTITGVGPEAKSAPREPPGGAVATPSSGPAHRPLTCANVLGDAVDDDRRQRRPGPLGSDHEATLERLDRPLEPVGRRPCAASGAGLRRAPSLRAWRGSRRRRPPGPGPPCAPGPRRGARRPPRRRARRAATSTPSAGASTWCVSRATGSGASGSPPWARIIRRHTSIARPSASASAGSTSPRPAPATISRARARVSSTTSGGPATGQHLDRLAHLERIAGGQAQRRLHVGQQGHGPDAGVRAESHHRLGELTRLAELLHEGPGPDLDVEHERTGALGDLLAHDRRGDERHARDGARDVAQRIELLVGRREPAAGRTDDGADVLELRQHLGVGQRGPPPRDRLELVERARRCGRARGPRAAGPRRRRRRRAERAAG